MSSGGGNTSGGVAVIDYALMRRAKPESLAAAEAVVEMLYVIPEMGSFSPLAKSDDIRSLAKRLTLEEYYSENGRPTVVFYTAEGATETKVRNTKAKTEVTHELQSSRQSADAYADVFDVVNSRQACICAMYINLVLVDVSEITREDDPFINKYDAPVMAFFNVHGECKTYLKGSMISASGFVRGVSKIIGNPVDARSRLSSVDKRLVDLEKLVRKEFVTNEDLKESQAAVAASQAKAKTKKTLGGSSLAGSGSRSSKTVRVAKLQEAAGEISSSLSTVREDIIKLTSTAADCSGCAICVAKAARAAQAVESSSPDSSYSQ